MFFRSLKKEKSSSRAGGYVVKAFFALSKQLWNLWLTLKELSIKIHICGISTRHTVDKQKFSFIEQKPLHWQEEQPPAKYFKKTTCSGVKNNGQE